MVRSFTGAVAVALSLGLALQGCTAGSTLPTLTITADPPNQTVKPGNFVTLKVTGTVGGNPFNDGMQPAPKLSTDYGSFEKITGSTSAADDVREKTDGTISGHTLTARLYADKDPGTATVKAEYDDPNGNHVEMSVRVEFKPYVATGEVRHLNFSCRTYNIGVFAVQDTTIQVPCNANATDSNDQLVTGADIKFIAEAGTMRFDAETHDNLFYFPTDPDALHTTPRDVSPEDLPGSVEPNWTSVSDGVVHNPRDGLVTIMAWVPASKGYVVDELALAEPYVDANDNQQYDDGENYVDLNQNGQWDEVQDDSESTPHALWRKIKVLWTGTLQVDPPVASVDPTYADVGNLFPQTFVLTLLDENYNVIAANDSTNDLILWGYSPQPDIALAAGQPESTKLYNPEDSRRFGMSLNSDFDFIDPTSDFNWKLGGTKSVVIQNVWSCENMSSNSATSEPFAVTGQVSRTLYLSSMGNPQGQQTEATIPVGGTLEAPVCSMH